MKIRSDTKIERAPVSCSLGVHFDGAALPKPDLGDVTTSVAGAAKRIMIEIPRGDKETLNRLRRFVARWLRDNLVPLRTEIDLSVKAWLETTNYSLARKTELWNLYQEMIGFDPKWKKVKSFIKDEPYVDFKHARTINSRSDEFKILVGPIFKAIEKVVFSQSYFIKKIPVQDRPAYIMEHVFQVGASVIATDYSSFESSFVRELQEAVEVQLYEYMTQNLNEHVGFRELYGHILGRQEIDFKEFSIEMNAIRMSGEMNTSLGNGFSNLMFFLFACEECGCTSPCGVVEGDDGLFSFYGKIPADFFKTLGLVIKLEEVREISEASFCGLIFDPDELCNICDPIKVLLNFGWTDRRYIGASRKRHLELIRAKSLSIKYQYPGCPILQALAEYGLRITRGITVRVDAVYSDVYQREQFVLSQAHARESEIGIKSRLLMERKFGITIEEQLAIERKLNSLTQLSVLCLPEVLHRVDPKFISYFEDYVRVADVRSPSLRFPALPRDGRCWFIKDLMNETQIQAQFRFGPT